MSSNKMLFNTVVLGALLHDIGKLLQKGDFGSLKVSGKHPEISGNFVRAYKEHFSQICDADLLETLVEKHHESGYFPLNQNASGAKEEHKPLAYMVSRADNYSSSERDEDYEGYKNYKTRPLDSVITRLSISSVQSKIKQYKPVKYSRMSIMPIEQTENNTQELNLLLKEFGVEINELMEKTLNKKISFNAFYYKMEALLLKYTWCIPSNSQEKIADISLYDHLKTTSAIAACLYHYHVDKNDFSLKSIKDDNVAKFNLVVADLSGIQNYIYEGLSMTSGSVAKRLRARSFNINMIMEYAGKLLIDTFGLFHSNILISTGGKIYVLLQNSSDYLNKFNQCKSDIQEFLFKQYRGLIALNFASVPLSGNDFGAEIFGEKMSELSKKLIWEKKRPFSNVLIYEQKWDEDKFVIPFKGDTKQELCSGCNREFTSVIHHEKQICSWCDSEIEQGTEIPHVKGVEFFDIKKNLNSSGFKLLNDNEMNVIQRNDNFYIAINRISGLDGVFINRNIAKHVPLKEDGSIKTFDEIADEALGSKHLAYLKADVDNLGSLFSFGLNEYMDGEIKHNSTISRITTMSRMFEMFFTGNLSKLIEDSFKNSYVVYSGGDDLLIIGPWNEIFKLAQAIQKQFCLFSGGNPNITLSAGIAVVKKKTPVVKAVEYAEEELEKSKERSRIVDGDKIDRNQITVFDRTMTWSGFEAVVTDGEKLVQWIGKGIANNSDMYKLKKYDDMFQRYYEKNDITGIRYEDTTGLMYVSLLSYDIGRKEEKVKYGEEYKSKEYIDWLKALKTITSDTIINLGVIVDYALLSNEKKNSK